MALLKRYTDPATGHVFNLSDADAKALGYVLVKPEAVKVPAATTKKEN